MGLSQDILTGIIMSLAAVHSAGIKLNIKGVDLITLLENAAAGVLGAYGVSTAAQSRQE